MTLSANDILSIGDLSRRTGLPVSAIRFYETKGLVEPFRSAGGTRRYVRSDIRRLSFVMIAQRLGMSIEQIAQTLASLPHGRTPNASDWKVISKRLRLEIDSRIRSMMEVRERLDGCIGCGCLSLRNCALFNPADMAGTSGTGPRFIPTGREPDSVEIAQPTSPIRTD